MSRGFKCILKQCGAVHHTSNYLCPKCARKEAKRMGWI